MGPAAAAAVPGTVKLEAVVRPEVTVAPVVETAGTTPAVSAPEP